MLRNFDRYGFLSSDIDELADELARLLDLKWRLHESSSFGLYYYYRFPDPQELGESFELSGNFFFDEEDRWREFSYKQCPIILYVNLTARSDEVEGMLRHAIPDVITIGKETLNVG